MALSVESLPSTHDFNLYPVTGYVSFICVLSCVLSGGVTNILMTQDLTKPALVYLSIALVVVPPEASEPRGFVF